MRNHSWTPNSDSSSSSLNGLKPTNALSAIVRTADLVDSDESGLITAWETHLADRVSALLQRTSSSSSSKTNEGGSSSSSQSELVARMIRSQLNLPQ